MRGARLPHGCGKLRVVRWNYTKTLLILAICYGLVAVVIGWAAEGKPEIGLARGFLIAVMAGPFMVLADLWSYLRERKSAGRLASSPRLR